MGVKYLAVRETRDTDVGLLRPGHVYALDMSRTAAVVTFKNLTEDGNVGLEIAADDVAAFVKDGAVLVGADDADAVEAEASTETDAAGDEGKDTDSDKAATGGDDVPASTDDPAAKGKAGKGKASGKAAG